MAKSPLEREYEKQRKALEKDGDIAVTGLIEGFKAFLTAKGFVL